MDWNRTFLSLICRLQGEACDLAPSAEKSDLKGLHYIDFCRMIGDYLLREITEQSLACAESFRSSLAGVTSFYASGVFHFYDSLLRMARRDVKPKDEHIAENQRKLWRWAQHAPDNYLHKYYLVEAERLNLAGRWEEAGSLYDQAAEMAGHGEFPNEEALAWELGGRFFLERGKDVVGRAYLEKAYVLYDSWGATVKSRHLRKEFTFIEEKNSPERIGLDSGDWLAAFEASRIISGEREIGGLAAKMTRVLLENSGAQRVLFLRRTDEVLWLQAEGIAGEPPSVKLSDAVTPVDPEIAPLTLLR